MKSGFETSGGLRSWGALGFDDNELGTVKRALVVVAGANLDLGIKRSPGGRVRTLQTFEGLWDTLTPIHVQAAFRVFGDNRTRPSTLALSEAVACREAYENQGVSGVKMLRGDDHTYLDVVYGLNSFARRSFGPRARMPLVKRLWELRDWQNIFSSSVDAGNPILSDKDNIFARTQRFVAEGGQSFGDAQPVSFRADKTPETKGDSEEDGCQFLMPVNLLGRQKLTRFGLPRGLWMSQQQYNTFLRRKGPEPASKLIAAMNQVHIGNDGPFHRWRRSGSEGVKIFSLRFTAHGAWRGVFFPENGRADYFLAAPKGDVEKQRAQIVTAAKKRQG